MSAAGEEALAHLYDEFSDGDRKLAETGLAHYAALLDTEDRNGLLLLLKAFTEELRCEMGSNLLFLTM